MWQVVVIFACQIETNLQMNKVKFADDLVAEGVISAEKAAAIQKAESEQPFSIYWELRSLLYLGITLLSSGLGVVVYENIDSIEHSVIIGVITAACIGCFYYAFRYRKPFTWGENTQSTTLDEFALLSGCLALLTLEGYLQYQYEIFGTRYGLVAFIPAVLFFILAYLFDHRGVLAMAITAFASWVGVNVIPVKMWAEFSFDGQRLIINALWLGGALIAVGYLSELKKLKKHFLFTFFILGGNIAFIAALAGLFTLKFKLIYFLITFGLSFVFILYARLKHSYLYLLMGIIYGYIALSYGIYRIMPDEGFHAFIPIYYMISAGLIIFFLVKIKDIIGSKND